MGLAERWIALTHYLGEIESGAAGQVSARMAAGDANWIEWEGRRKQAEEIRRQCDVLAMTYPVDDVPPISSIVDVDDLATRVAEVLAGRNALNTQPDAPPSPFDASFDSPPPVPDEPFGG